MRDQHAGRKGIDYTYVFSDVFHSAGCIKMGTGKPRIICFRQDVRKIDFFRIFLIIQVSLSNCYNFLIVRDLRMNRARIK